MTPHHAQHADLFCSVAEILVMIAAETDPVVLHKYVNTCYDVDVMRAAANRIYDLLYKEKK